MLPTSISSVQFGFGIARSLIRFDTWIFRAHKGNAVLVCGSTTVKYPGASVRAWQCSTSVSEAVGRAR